MKRAYLISILLCLLMTMNACNKTENSINTDEINENAETETADTEAIEKELEEKFLEKLSEYTDEKVAAIVIDCFAGSNQYGAFVVTVSNQYSLPEEGAEIEDYFITSSLWYIDEVSCINVYQNDYNGSVLLSSGILKNGMHCASVGQLSAYAPEVNYNTSYYMVENGKPIYLFTTVASVINGDGCIETTEAFWEDGRRIKHCTYDYQDGELIFIEESFVE